MKNEKLMHDLSIKCQRYSYLLGIATAIINHSILENEKKEWFLSAVEEVIYKNNPVPSFTENEETNND